MQLGQVPTILENPNADLTVTVALTCDHIVKFPIHSTRVNGQIIPAKVSFDRMLARLLGGPMYCSVCTTHRPWVVLAREEG